MNKTGSNTLRLWKATNIGSIQEHTSHKIILDTISHRRSKTSSRTARRILTKEKLDKQLTGQISTRSFINIRNETERKVLFNARDELGDKIDKVTVIMGRLTAKDSNEKRPFKPQIYKSRGSYPQGQNRSYNQRSYQNKGRLGSRSDSRNRGQYGNNRHSFQQTIETTIFKRTLGDMEDIIVEEKDKDNRCDDYNRSRDRPRKRTF